MKSLYIISLALLAISCTQKSPQRQAFEEAETAIEAVDKSKPKMEPTPAEEILTEFVVDDNDVSIMFPAFTIVMDSTEVWDEQGVLDNVQGDTAAIYVEFGDHPWDKRVAIFPSIQGEVKVFQRFENSITIMNEGPHCDLIDWKHFDSEWEEIPLANNQFTTLPYPSDRDELFVHVGMDEVYNAVLDQCGEEWAQHMKDATSPTDYPCGVGLSRIFLKVELHHNDIVTENVVSFEIPMGC